MSPKRSAAPETHENSRHVSNNIKLNGNWFGQKLSKPDAGPLGTYWTHSHVSLWCFWLFWRISRRLLPLEEDRGDGSRYKNCYTIVPLAICAGFFSVILSHRRAESTYLLLSAFDPPSVPSVQQNNILLTCWCTRAAFLGIRPWAWSALPTHLSVGKRGTSSALPIHLRLAGRGAVKLSSETDLPCSTVLCLWWGESVEDSNSPLSWMSKDRDIA